MGVRHLAPRPEGIEEHLGELPSELFDERFYRSWELVDGYAAEWSLRLARDLRLEKALQRPRSATELRGELELTEGFEMPLRWLLARLEEEGLAAADDAAGEAAYRLVEPLPEPDLAAVRAACLEADPANEPALDLLDLAGHAYPRVARGEVSGQEALLGLGQTGAWLRYFHNDNPTYAINNRLAAVVAANRLPPQGAVEVLEVGGGGGSGTLSLLSELAARGQLERLGRYRFTEPSPFFRRRAERELRSAHPDAPWEFAALDLDERFAAAAGGPFDLVLAVNVLHVARDLPSTLGELRRVLRPGGWLVAAEAVRPFPGQPLSTELVFQLLEDFRDVELHPRLRPNPGFLTPENWRQLLAGAGFDTVQIVPDLEAIREIYPRFFAGVVCGRPTAL